MKGRRGFTLIELLVVIAIIAILAAILFPVFARVRKTAQNSDCQSNMKQIGNAFKMYLGEWRDAYPYQDITKALIRLSPTDPPVYAAGDPTPMRFVSGINWVEALFPYMEAISKDSAGSWNCKAAADMKDKGGGGLGDQMFARVNYVMNANLVGQPEGIIKTASTTLLCREIDRKVNAILRPSNVSSDGSTAPIQAFLNANDAACNPSTTNPKQHSNGSNVLFSDGHVKSFNSTDMPVAPAYDSTDGQWYNLTTGPAGRRKSIAITP